MSADSPQPPAVSTWAPCDLPPTSPTSPARPASLKSSVPVLSSSLPLPPPPLPSPSMSHLPSPSSTSPSSAPPPRPPQPVSSKLDSLSETELKRLTKANTRRNIGATRRSFRAQLARIMQRRVPDAPDAYRAATPLVDPDLVASDGRAWPPGSGITAAAAVAAAALRHGPVSMSALRDVSDGGSSASSSSDADDDDLPRSMPVVSVCTARGVDACSRNVRISRLVSVVQGDRRDARRLSSGGGGGGDGGGAARVSVAERQREVEKRAGMGEDGVSTRRFQSPRASSAPLFGARRR